MKTLLLISFITASVSTLFAQNFTREVKTLTEDFRAQTTSLNPDFLLHSSVPPDHHDPVPLIVYLHGGGGKGTDIHKLPRRPPVLPLIEKHIEEPCIIVSPQCLPGSNKDKRTWLAEDLNVLLAYLKSTEAIDESRVYLTGYSMGGYGSWMWGGSNPEHFAAIVPCSGGIGQLGPKDISPDSTDWARNLVPVPLWAFHGARDKVVPADRSKTMLEQIKKHGGKKARLTVFPDLGHNSMGASYRNPELAHWMFKQRK